MPLNIGSLLKPMVNAAKKVFGDKWPEVKSFTEMQFKNLAQTAIMIGKLQAEDKITREQAKYLWEMQKNAAQAVLLAVEGMGIILVQNAINAALGTVKDVINKALGWKLIA